MKNKLHPLTQPETALQRTQETPSGVLVPSRELVVPRREISRRDFVYRTAAWGVATSVVNAFSTPAQAMLGFRAGMMAKPTPPSGGGTITFVQSTSGNSGAANSSTQVITFGSNVTVGNVLVVSCHVRAQNTSSISGLCTTWTNATGQINSGSGTPCMSIWYGVVTSAGTSLTVTFASSTGCAAAGYEFHGATGAVDSSTSGSATGTANPITGTINTTHANVALVGASSLVFTTALSSGPTNSFTNVLNAPSTGSNTSNRMVPVSAYKVVSATGGYTTDWTMTLTGAWGAGIVAIY